jgi:methionyl-tRNA synthetase
VVAQANRYFAAEEPWVKRKSDPARMATILYVTAEVLRVIAIFVQPFMPVKMGQLLDLLAASADARSFDKASAENRLAAGTALPPPAPIFPRYVEPEEGQRAPG